MAVESLVRTELRNNAYDEANNHVVLTEGQEFAWKYLVNYYMKMNSKNFYCQFIAKEQDVFDTAAFFYWGAWLSAAARPGETYSYTHKWPHEPLAGNEPTPAVILWSAASVFVLFVGMMFNLFM
eukprot:343914_1